MDIKLQLNRAMIALDAFFKGVKKSNKSHSTKTILIVFQQILGDSIILQPSLQRYTKIYPECEGYTVKMLVRPQVFSFMKETLPLPENIIYESVDFKLFLEDYRYYQKIVKKYRGEADILIVPGTSLSAEVFSAASDANRKIGLTRNMDVKKPFIMAVFTKIAYTERVRPEKTDMILQMHRLLMHYLGDTEYKARLPMLLPKDKIINDKHYCVVCPGSSMMAKCWPADRFSAAIDHIFEKYGLRSHLCGGTNEEKFEFLILSKVNHPEAVVSHIGKSSFSDWSAIVQHADLVLSNDSATIHMAVAARVPAICIVGVHAKYQVFPYMVDEINSGDKLPIFVLKNMSCERCCITGYYIGSGNSECMKRIIKNRCSICVDAIKLEDVLKEIDKVLDIETLSYQKNKVLD
ncbi:glycosyltransferase family 9 protein [Enterocloster sp. OA13]|uniref:glycosyltransferase family 9 protein n=1 Tax=Enterocloster sp. OA13 TaxID=2914161 RepID=UPI001F05709C|nr:glycosyltransferase family 9 protein [Enterocloster sp. OA13]